MRIGVVTRNPRLYSSKRLIQAIRDVGHEAVIIDPFRCVLQCNPLAIRHKNRPLPTMAFVIPRIATQGFPVVMAVLRHFEAMGVPLVNSTSSIALARDKWATLQTLAMAGLPIPTSVFSTDPLYSSHLTRHLGSPVVLKTLDGTQGAGVMVAESRRSARSIVECLNTSRTDFIAQEYIAEAGNSDIRCLVLDGKILAAMQRKSADDDFRANIHLGGEASVVQLSADEIRVAIAAAQVVGVRFAGVDLLRRVWKGLNP
ncbi:RimK family alpha-L-glutamate ligase [bacterium]|nr:RimK family alpha-L-glutamate ligase [bacterium]